jgi:hypothetical protein
MFIRRVATIWILLVLTSATIHAALPIINEGGPAVIPGEYVAVFKTGTPLSEVTDVELCVERLGGKILFRYRTALLGFAAKMPPAALQFVRARPSVASIEANQIFKLDYNTEVNPPKGLDRVDQRLLTSANQNKFTYTDTGATVNAYVIDTGIRKTHVDFGGRATGLGYTAVTDGHGTDDCNGHGTHVAGTIGGTKYGIAKNVSLHSVRVFGCGGGGSMATVAAGVDWVTLHRVGPAVVNISLGGPPSPTLDAAVTSSIGHFITYVVSAGNDLGGNACAKSPARTPAAITVGATDPASDMRAGFSNIGPCLDLFAPGLDILSAGIASNTDSATLSGTSMAAPHVTGVAALYLQHHPNATPAQVWSAIHSNDDVPTTPGWGGVINRGAGSPNELLHWGALTDGHDDGGAHLTTVDGVHYNFPSAGEFVLLRGDGVEIQTRRTPVATTFNPGPDPYDGLAMCPSLTTAIAARAGKDIVTYQPADSDASVMQLRINGALTTLSADGVSLTGGGRVIRSPAGDGIEIQFPDGTVLIAIPGWWASAGKSYLNVQTGRTRAAEGIMGAIAEGSWLPALPNGESLGAMPGSLHQRFVDLNQTFANAWRVTPDTSLFDYAPGTSTATFTLVSWPSENSQCALPGSKPAATVETAVAQSACKGLNEERARDDCVFDVLVTGDTRFAKTHLISQSIRTGGTTTTAAGDSSTSMVGSPVTFTAMVAFLASEAKGSPAGTVQFSIDGKRAGDLVKLDTSGRAIWTTPALALDVHQVEATYVVSPKPSGLLPSSSGTIVHKIVPWWSNDDTTAQRPASK